MGTVLQQARAYSEEHYDNCYDLIVECYDDEELGEFLSGMTTLQEFVDRVEVIIEARGYRI